MVPKITLRTSKGKQKCFLKKQIQTYYKILCITYFREQLAKETGLPMRVIQVLSLFLFKTAKLFL